MRKKPTSYAVLSASIPGTPEPVGRPRLWDMMDTLQDFGITICEVSIVVDGKSEPGVVATLRGGILCDDHDNTRAIARAYGQDSILYIGPDGLAFRDYLERGESLELLGSWEEILPWEDQEPGFYVRDLDGRRVTIRQIKVLDTEPEL